MYSRNLYLAGLFLLFSVAFSITCHKGQKMAHKGALLCLECDHDTFMPEDNHNKTDCYQCSTVRDGYVAAACNITGNSTPVDKDHDGRPLDIASFNCSHLPAVYKNCLGEEIHSGDPNQAGNVTDQACTAPSVTAFILATIILLGLITVGLIILVSALILDIAALSTKLLPVMNFLAEHQLALERCCYIMLFVLIGCCLATFIALLVNPLHGFIISMMFVLDGCFFALIVLAVLKFLLHHHLSQKASHDCVSSPFICKGDDSPHKRGL